jgi:hypothetical protein
MTTTHHTYIYTWSHLLLLLCTFTVSGCVSYDAAPFAGKVLPRISGYTTGVTNDWIYFNLRTGEVFNVEAPNRDIREGEQLNRTDWDLAFCGYRLRTNSGTSGIGKGGAIDLGYGNYERWTSKEQLPKDAEWTADNDSTVEVTMSQRDWNSYLLAHGMAIEDNPWFDPNRGPQQTLTNANPVLSQAMDYAGPPPSYLISMHTYALRTADGARYFKIQIVSWYNADDEIGGNGGRVSYYCDELK